MTIIKLARSADVVALLQILSLSLENFDKCFQIDLMQWPHCGFRLDSWPLNNNCRTWRPKTFADHYKSVSKVIAMVSSLEELRLAKNDLTTSKWKLRRRRKEVFSVFLCCLFAYLCEPVNAMPIPHVEQNSLTSAMVSNFSSFWLLINYW